MTPGKRAFDIFFALGVILTLWPLMLGIALAIWAREGRPVLYGAERMRSPDRAFTLWKFRTMAGQDAGGVTGADKAGRITPLGRWLRRTRLDELPQVWNILKGDVTLVGPRPPLRVYVERFPEIYGRVLQSRPGVTGLATIVFHRREERLLAACRDAAETDAVYCRRCIPAKARLDLIHARHAGFCHDLRLIWVTILRIFGRGGTPGRRRPAPPVTRG